MLGQFSCCDTIAQALVGGPRFSKLRQDEEEFEDELSVTESFAAKHEGAMRRPSLSVARQMFDFFETNQNGQQIMIRREELVFLHDTINVLADDLARDKEGVGKEHLMQHLDTLDAKLRSNTACEFFLDEYAGEDHHTDAPENSPSSPNLPRPKSMKNVYLVEDLSLQNINSWEFDVFSTKSMTRSPIRLIGSKIFAAYGLASRLQVSEDRLSDFLQAVDDGYRPSNNVMYHNNLHGADVMQTCHVFIVEIASKVQFSWLMRAAAVIAAGAHDVGHPGVNNAYLEAMGHELAIRYNNMSILENFHSAWVFQLMQKEHLNIFENLQPTEHQAIRKTIVTTILETDMAKHAGSLESFEDKVRHGALDLNTEEGQGLLIKTMMHASDIANPAKPWDVYSKWTPLLIEEFYRQGDLERKNGLKVNPMMDRERPIPLEKFQTGFITAIVLPLFHALSKVEALNMRIPCEHLNANNQRWIDYSNSH